VKIESELTKICSVLGNGTRFTTLLMLMEDKRPVEIALCLEISQPAISKAIRSLVSNGLIKRDGFRRNMRYHIPDKTRELVDNLHAVIGDYVNE